MPLERIYIFLEQQWSHSSKVIHNCEKKNKEYKTVLHLTHTFAWLKLAFLMHRVYPDCYIANDLHGQCNRKPS